MHKLSNMFRQVFSVINHSPGVKWIDPFVVVVVFKAIKHFPNMLTHFLGIDYILGPYN